MSDLNNIIFEWYDTIMEINAEGTKSMKEGIVYLEEERDPNISPDNYLHSRALIQIESLKQIGEIELRYGKSFKFTVRYNVPSPFSKNRDLGGAEQK